MLSLLNHHQSYQLSPFTKYAIPSKLSSKLSAILFYQICYPCSMVIKAISYPLLPSMLSLLDRCRSYQLSRATKYAISALLSSQLSALPFYQICYSCLIVIAAISYPLLPNMLSLLNHHRSYSAIPFYQICYPCLIVIAAISDPLLPKMHYDCTIHKFQE